MPHANQPDRLSSLMPDAALDSFLIDPSEMKKENGICLFGQPEPSLVLRRCDGCKDAVRRFRRTPHCSHPLPGQKLRRLLATAKASRKSDQLTSWVQNHVENGSESQIKKIIPALEKAVRVAVLIKI